MSDDFYNDDELAEEEYEYDDDEYERPEPDRDDPEYLEARDEAMEYLMEDLSHEICEDYSELNRVITVMASTADYKYKKQDFDKMCKEAKEIAEAQHPDDEDKQLETFLRLVWLDGYSSGAADVSLAVKNDENGIRDAIQNYEK